MDPDTDVCQTEQPQISYSVDFTAEQSSAMCHGITYHYHYHLSLSPILLLQSAICYLTICYAAILNQIAMLLVLPFAWEGLLTRAAAATGDGADAPGMPCCEL